MKLKYDKLLSSSTCATTTWGILHFAGAHKPWSAGATFYNDGARYFWEQHAQDYCGEKFVA